MRSVRSARMLHWLWPADRAHYRAYVGPPGQFDFLGATQFRLWACANTTPCSTSAADRFALAAFSFPISCPDATMGSNPSTGLLKTELVGCQWIESNT